MHIKGEPLLHSSFPTLIKICKENNINVNITTNGTLIKKQIETLKTNEIIRQINISFHSYNDLDEIKIILNSCDEILKNNHNVNIVYRFWTYSKKNQHFQNVIQLICNHYNCSYKKEDLLSVKGIAEKKYQKYSEDLFYILTNGIYDFTLE